MLRPTLSLAYCFFLVGGACAGHVEGEQGPGAASSSQTNDTPGASQGNPTSSAGTPGASSGSSGTSSAPSGNGNSTPAAPTGVLNNLDFEDGTTGAWQIMATDANSMVETATVAHGSHALRLVAGSDVNDDAFLVNTSLFPLTPNQFYVRFYINLAVALGQNHTAFALAAGDGQNSEVRMGGQFSILVANLESTDGERISADSYNGFPNGVPLTPGTWYCMEINYDGVNQAMHTSLNGSEIKNLAVTTPQDWNSPPNSSTWMPTFSTVKLGWESYGGGTGNTVYLDDIAVSHNPIGCLP